MESVDAWFDGDDAYRLAFSSRTQLLNRVFYYFPSEIFVMRLGIAAFLILGSFLAAGDAEANITVTALEVGPDVVFSFSGSLDVSSFGAHSGIGGAASAFQSPDTLYNVHHLPNDRYYPSITAPSAFSTNGSLTPTTTWSVSAGNDFAVDGGSVYLPFGYISNTSISSTMTYSGQTIAGLGLIPGTYVWTLPGSQTVTLTIGPVPTVTSVSPTSGSSAGGTSIMITGTNFTGATGVTVGGNACTGITVVSATSITCTTSSGTAGPASILVTTADGTNAANTLFTYTAAPASIPSLSEWMQLMLALMVMTVIGWHFHRERSY
jgi:hypothetical protein